MTSSSYYSRYHYLTKTDYDGNSNYTIDLLRYTGGSLDYASSGRIRGITALNDSPIQWKDARNLTLAVKKDNVRYFITDNDDLSQYDEVEGVAVFIGAQKFIIKLHDEQSGTVTKDTAMALYEDVLPTKEQAEVISMMYADINYTLAYFGGSEFLASSSSYSSYHYFTKNAYSSSSNYTIDLLRYSAGHLDYASSGHIRGVITIED